MGLFETNTATIWAIDQGLTFNFDTNIRTVMFEFIGVEYPEDLIGDICNLVKKMHRKRISQIYASASFRRKFVKPRQMQLSFLFFKTGYKVPCNAKNNKISRL